MIDKSSNQLNSEVIFGLVAPVGVDLDKIKNYLSERLKDFLYNASIDLRVSQFIKELIEKKYVDVKLNESTEFDRINSLMKAGNEIRRISKDNGFLSYYLAMKIGSAREQQKINDVIHTKPLGREAHIIRSLKRPEEIRELKKIYGNAFFLIGVFSNRQKRKKNLMDLQCTEEQAEQLIDVDAREDSDDHGQRTATTFQMSDLFIDMDSKDFQSEIDRFLNLVFNHPIESPRLSEYAMFLAYASAARSADLSRQVGAVIVKDEDIVAVGCNEVPKFGGGQYLPDDFYDKRDHKFKDGYDMNSKIKNESILKLVNKLASRFNIDSFNGKTDDEKIIIGKDLLSENRFSEVTEFHRAVHAEMSAITCCVRLGIPIKGCRIYATTYPCHNCAKHIVASGISEVLFIEPYSKSLADELHGDAIKDTNYSTSIDESSNDRKVIFKHYQGVSARRYLDFFSIYLTNGIKLERKDSQGKAVEFNKEKADIITPLSSTSYLQNEMTVANYVKGCVK